MFKYFPVSNSGRRLRGAAVQVQTIVITCVGVLAVGTIGYLIFSGSAEDLLDAESLTPKQIRLVTTKLLLHDDLKIRERASEKLLSSGKAAVPILKDVSLTHSEQRLRLAVLGILTRLNADATIEVLHQMIDDADAKVRVVAARATAKLDDPRTIPILEKALEDSDPGVRLIAIGACELREIKSAVPALKRALDDPTSSIRRHAARALEQLTGVDYRDRIKRR
ncbi:MAG: HEAT repeat domain-containing protein [Planctomycetota bacterium]|nr:MAG: HEAT repeat domain-containing protein [Planctomycetota bacterium]